MRSVYKNLNAHTNAVGGAWGEDTYAALVRDDCEEVFETPEEEDAGLDDTTPKRALLMPLVVFTSSHIMKIGTATGMSNYLISHDKITNLWKSIHNLK